MTAGNGRDLVVVGGGVVGLAAAREAARRGLRVTVLERGRPAREASWAGAGMLSPVSEAAEDGPFLDFGLASLRLWPGWAAELEAEAGTTVEFRESGKLRVALSPGEEERLRSRVTWARERDLAVEWLDAPSLRKEVPQLAETVRGGIRVEPDFRVDNRLLGRALERAAGEAGVEVRPGTPVRGIRSHGNRVTGVELEDGSILPTPRVVVAAGAWSASLEGLSAPLPVRPVRGQMLSLRPPSLPSHRLVESEEVYLVPRADGRLLVGATMEETGFEAGVTAGGIRDLLAGVLRLCPELAGSPLVELWSGFRPGSPDGNPILGPDPALEGLFLGTGHFRNGILLAPLTALILGSLAAEADAPAIPRAFRPGRFHPAGRGPG